MTDYIGYIDFTFFHLIIFERNGELSMKQF